MLSTPMYAHVYAVHTRAPHYISPNISETYPNLYELLHELYCKLYKQLQKLYNYNNLHAQCT